MSRWSKSASAASLAAFVALAGCAGSEDAIRIRWIKAESVADADLWCETLMKRRAPMMLRGCQTWDRAQRVCIVVAPAGDNETLGHEVRHCFEGAWHK